MRCREIKHRLNNKAELTEEHIAHIKSCPACAHEAYLAGMLDSSFTALKDITAERESSFEHVKNRVISRAAKDRFEEKSFMARVKNEIKQHPRLCFGVSLTAVIVAVMLLVPVSYPDIVGYSVAVEDVQLAGVFPQQKIFDLINSMGYDDSDVELSQSEDGYDIKVTNIPTEEASQQVGLSLLLATGNNGSFKVSPVINLVSGNLYAQVKKEARIKIDSKEKTDEEVQKELQEKLEEMGFTNNIVKVKPGASGSRVIWLNMNDSTSIDSLIWDTPKNIVIDLSKEGYIEFGLLDDASNIIRIDPGYKSVPELKKEIEEKLKAKGYENSEMIVREPEEGGAELEIILKDRQQKK